MKIKAFIVPIIILILGYIVQLVGSLFKIMHWPFGSLFLIIATFIMVVALVMAIIILIRIKNNNEH